MGWRKCIESFSLETWN